MSSEESYPVPDLAALLVAAAPIRASPPSPVRRSIKKGDLAKKRRKAKAQKAARRRARR